MQDFILTLSCPDRVGIVHRVSQWLLDLNGNIVDAQQFGDASTQRFFLRVHFQLPIGQDSRQHNSQHTCAGLQASFQAVAHAFDMQAQIHDAAHKSRLLILVSRQGHCLNDLLFRTHSGQLNVEIAAIASNHQDCAKLAASWNVPFHHLPIAPKPSPDARARQEAQILQLVENEGIDLVVLARYMQILSPQLCAALAGRSINIHHSFLPSFKGARPYHQAHARGVKIIGATAHYVTSDLDEGPIMLSNLCGVDFDKVSIGQRVQAVFITSANGQKIPMFTPCDQDD